MRRLIPLNKTVLALSVCLTCFALPALSQNDSQSEPGASLKQAQSQVLGNYQLNWRADQQQFQIQSLNTVLDQPLFVLDATHPLKLNHSPLQISENRGSFQIGSRLNTSCQELRIDSLKTDAQTWILKGYWQEAACQGQDWELKAFLSPEKHLELQIVSSASEPRDFNQLSLSVPTLKQEQWFGAGEQFSHIRLNGKTVPIWIQENGIGRGQEPISSLLNLLSPGSSGHAFSTYIAVPWLFSSSGKGFYLKQYDYIEFDLKQAEMIQINVWSRGINLNFLQTASPLSLIEDYTQWAGRMTEPPDWVDQGAWIGMQGGTQKVRELWQALQKKQTPIAAFWLQDWVGKRKTSIGSQLWWNWVLNQKQYPDWQALIQELNHSGVHVLGYLNPFLVDIPTGVNSKRNLFQEALQQGFLLKNNHGQMISVNNTDFSAGMLDLSNAKARHWFKQVVKQEVIQQGFSGWMADYGEAYPLDARNQAGEPAMAAHNHYAELWASLQAEIIQEVPEQPFFAFLRSGFSQSPAYASMFWQGDQSVSWDGHDGLRSSLKGLLSAGLSGFSLMHSDAGGYTSVCQIGLCRSSELMMRWLELNAFTSLLRTHEGNQPDAQVQIYSDPEMLAAFDRSARIYQAWRPLRRQLFKEAQAHGWPVVSHLMLYYPQDLTALQIDDQFMLGQNVLVAPVLDPGVSERKVYLPAGRWRHLWSDQVFVQTQGGDWHQVTAPIGKPPVFVREGSEQQQLFEQAFETLKQ